MTNTKFVRGEFQSWIDLVSNLGFTDIVSPEDGFVTELSSRQVIPPILEGIWRRTHAAICVCRFNFWTGVMPPSAMLARAEKDDYASGIFYPENPIRALQGKTEGLPQRFALEFFIKFKGNDRGQKAQFKVSFARLSEGRRHSAKVWATVPVKAE